MELKYIHGNTSSSGDKIKYEVLYNYSNGFEDFVETFEQRLLEHEGILEGRYELFLDALNGQGSWWESIIASISSLAGVFDGIREWFQAKAIEQLATLVSNPPTISNYMEHKTRIDNWVLEGRKLLFVAHSQGNLFVNAAHDYAKNKVPTNSLKVIHIAPASPILNGQHTLADLDLVINGLRLVGSVAEITDNIPGYLSRPTGSNGKKDALGHGLLEIYLNQELAISNRVKNQINSALDSLEFPPSIASSGYFTVTLKWDGAGDVDLHVFEPDNSHVYFSSPQGTSGYLDVDNTRKEGPEHYFASCDSSTLQIGQYKIGVANYSRADGRKATVQVASWNNGVLGTKSVTLGVPTGSTPAQYLFSVLISQDMETGKYSVSVN
ncbi:hypothetical protein [Shewanella morhuae]|uniref:hypothetical protein n=1 Tax=Shewanella morhuae TaxID=365591 RepID=UPI001C6A338C|nr:hypothetical protein [Shewanella morhuae]